MTEFVPYRWQCEAAVCNRGDRNDADPVKRHHPECVPCYDFPLMVVHQPGCNYTKGGICNPRPSSEAPEATVREYMAALEYFRTGSNPDGRFKRTPKSGGASVNPHNGELSQ